jgi:hypothetical protein
MDALQTLTYRFVGAIVLGAVMEETICSPKRERRMIFIIVKDRPFPCKNVVMVDKIKSNGPLIVR